MYYDITGHGTSVAGIIALTGKVTGLKGINPNVQLYSVKVLDNNNMAPISRIIEAIYWCIDNDIDIINMSFGTPHYSVIWGGTIIADFNYAYCERCICA